MTEMTISETACEAGVRDAALSWPDAGATPIIQALKRVWMAPLAAGLLAGCASADRPEIQVPWNDRIPEPTYLAGSYPMPGAVTERESFVKQAALSQVEEESSSVLRLPELIAEGLEKNPEIRAAGARWRAAQARIRAATSLEDPILSFTRFIKPVETRVGPQRNKFGISQKFPFFGKLSLKGEIAARKAEEAKYNYEARKLELIARVKSAYYRLFLIYKSVDITEENVELLRRFVQIARVKYATGKASQQDVLKAEVRLSRLADELITLRQKLKTAEADLNVLLNRAPQAFLGSPGEVERRRFDARLEDLQQTALGQQPLLLARQAAIDKSEAALALAKREYFPDFTLGVDYTDVEGGTTLSREDGKDAVSGTVRLNLPLWVDRRNAEVEAALATVGSARANYETAKNSILFDVQDGLIKVETAERLGDLFADTLVPQAEQTLEASLIGYEADKVDFLDLLDSQRVLQDLRLEYFRALVDFEQRLADLERAVGGELARQ